MPKVSSGYFIHEDRRNRLEYDVKYGSPTGRRRDSKVFYIVVPDIMKDWYREAKTKNKNGFYVGRNVTAVTANTEKEVIEQFEKIATEFFDAGRKVEKVIVLKMDFSLFSTSKEPKGYGTWNDPKYRDLAWQETEGSFPDQRLEIGYKVGYLSTVGDIRTFSTDEAGKCNRDTISDKDRERVIPWTTEREKWLSGMYLKFSDMITQCKKFYDQDEKKLVTLIDNKQKLLTQ